MTYTITIEPSGRTVQVDSDDTILAAAIRQGVPLPYGCKDGACGSCKCDKLSGDVTLLPYQPSALSDAERAAGKILTCRAKPQSDVQLLNKQVGAANALPVLKMPMRVMSLAKASPDVMVVQLQLPANQHFVYHPGQYVEFILAGGVRRSYSMANAVADQEGGIRTIELHIRHMPGGVFTDHVFGAMKEKDILRAEGPFGSFYLRSGQADAAKPMIFLASGTGFAPIKALLEQMYITGNTRPVSLYWGGRRPQDLYLHDWVLDMQTKLPNLRYVPVVSDALPEDAWAGRTGFVHQAVLADYPDLSAYQAYACGAPIVVDSARRDFVQLANLPEDQFFADSFTTSADHPT